MIVLKNVLIFLKCLSYCITGEGIETGGIELAFRRFLWLTCVAKSLKRNAGLKPRQLVLIILKLRILNPPR